MKAEFSKSWISSTKPNKQRKYRFNAPLHIKGKFLNAHLSKDLRAKYGTRSLRLRVGDRVRVMVGQFKRTEGKVEEVDVKNTKVYISKAEYTKRDGSKSRYPINPSNLMIVEVATADKKRAAKLSHEKKPAQKKEKAAPKAAAPKAAKPAAKPAEKTQSKPAEKKPAAKAKQ